MTTQKRELPPLGQLDSYPVLPLRDIVVFPHMIVPLFVGREKSIRALEEVMKSNAFILLATQKNPSDDDPEIAAIFQVGTPSTKSLTVPSGSLSSCSTLESVPTW